MKKATMLDVAKLAGVSQSTVSFVFSGAEKRNENLQVNKKPIVYAVLQHH